MISLVHKNNGLRGHRPGNCVPLEAETGRCDEGVAPGISARRATQAVTPGEEGHSLQGPVGGGELVHRIQAYLVAVLTSVRHGGVICGPSVSAADCPGKGRDRRQ